MADDLLPYDIRVEGVRLNSYAFNVDLVGGVSQMPDRALLGINGPRMDGVNPIPGRFASPPQFRLSMWVSDRLASGAAPQPERVLATNSYPDPSHEYGLSPLPAASNGGAAGTLSLDALHVRSGAQAVKYATTADGTTWATGASIGTPAELGFTVGDQITLSAWVYIPSTTTPYVTTLALAGAAFSGQTLSDLPVERDQFVQVTATATVADENLSVIPRLYGGTVTGDTIWYDDFGLAKGVADFSGDTPAGSTYAYRWTSTPGASSSEQYIPQVGAGNSRAQLEENLRSVFAAFTSQSATITVERRMPDGSTRTCEARVVGSVEPTLPGVGDGNPVARCQWLLDIPSVFWRDASGPITWTTKTLGSFVDVDALGPSTAPITDGIYKVHGPITNPRIGNTYGGYVQYTGTVPAGSTWTVDAGAFTSKVDGVSVLRDTDYYHSATYLMELWQPYQLKLTGSGTDLTTELELTADRKFF